MAPFAPLRWSDMKDAILRLPAFMLGRRPESIPNKTAKRAVNNRGNNDEGQK
jgi:hypothetical protein